MKSTGFAACTFMNAFNYTARRVFTVLVFCLSACVLSSCSTPRTASMTPQDVTIQTSHPEKVFVTVGSQAVPTPTPYDNNPQPVVTAVFTQSFHDALVQALTSSKLYQIADSAESSDFVLEVTILRGGIALETQYSGSTGAAPSTYMIAKWRFKKTSTGAVVCEKDITTAGTSDNFIIVVAGQRQRNATEFGAANNIRAGLEWLARKTQ